MSTRRPHQRYKWAAQPPPKTRTEIPIVRVRAGRSIQAVCLSSTVEGLLVHFLGARTRACVGTLDTCEGCAQGWVPRWKGYLGVFFPTQGARVYLVELTPRAYETLERSALGVSDYRGRWIQVERAPGRPNAAVRAFVLARAAYEGELPELPNVRDAIEYIMEAPDRRAPNNVPAPSPAKPRDKGDTQ